MILTTYKSWEEPASTIRNDHESKPFKTRKSCGKIPPCFWESQNLSKPGQDIIAPLRSPYPFGNVSQHRFLGESGMETILRSGFFRFVSSDSFLGWQIILPSGKLTWQWKMDQLKMYSLLKMVIFHCHVSLLEGRNRLEN